MLAEGSAWGFWGTVVGAVAALSGGVIAGRLQLKSDREARTLQREARQRELRVGDLRDFQDAFDIELQHLIKVASYLQQGASVSMDDALYSVAVRLKSRSSVARTGDQILRERWNAFGEIAQVIQNAQTDPSDRDAEIKKLGPASTAVLERVAEIIEM